MNRLKIIYYIKKIKNFFDNRKTNKLGIDKPKKKKGCLFRCCLSLIIFFVLLIAFLYKLNDETHFILSYIMARNEIITIKNGPNMHYARYNHSQVTLDDGDVLVVGGVGDKVQHQPELYIAKKNKFIKLKKTECAYHSPEIFKDTKGRVIISEDTCKNVFTFNPETKGFEIVEDKPIKDTRISTNSKFSNKKSTYFDINTLKKNKRDFEKINDFSKMVMYHIEADKLRAVPIIFTSPRTGERIQSNIVMCDKGSGFALQESCQLPFENRMYGRYTENYPLAAMFEHSILNSAISKIGENKYLITGGSSSEKMNIDIPHKHTQILMRNERLFKNGK